MAAVSNSNNNAENEMKRREDSGVVKSRVKKQGRLSSSSISYLRSSSFLRSKFGCLGLDIESPTVDQRNEDGSVDMVSASAHGVPVTSSPTHLIVMVNGIIGSAQDWRYAAKHFLKAYPQDVIVHCSERNTATSTFDGVDIMGERLADEVISVTQRYPHLGKISFIGHSLGGLIARYAIALLYGSNYLRLSKNREMKNDKPGVLQEQECIGKVAGLEPVNFITFASPHLGSRAHNQVPMFCGFRSLEILARQSSWFLGRSGRHLFLTDRDKGKPPLLLRMVHDCEGLPFMSALHSFKRRAAYANVCFDKLVGWCTSSLRRETQLPQWQHMSRHDKYRHIVNEDTTIVNAPQQILTWQSSVNWRRRMRSQEMMEVMITQLTKLSWERVDVKFGGGKHRLFAHNSIQVQTYCIHSAGADVIQHMIDHFVV